ncbi:glycosyltransferase [Labrys okinawensis]|uniref:glycosyltransferase n=1 Tax=Labrys okinawensis TaxID=346911 RepID=UPI0011B1E31C|nr:glycosyltransferase [Labrys okinawensis]
MSRVTEAPELHRNGDAPAEHASPRAASFDDGQLEGAAIAMGGALHGSGSPVRRKAKLAAVTTPQDSSSDAELQAALDREAAATRRIRELEAELAERSLAEDTVTLTTRLQQLERDLDVYREAKRSAELAVLDTRSVWKHAEQRIAKLRESHTYRLGQVMMNGFSSWRDGLRLPARIAEWYRDYRHSLSLPGDLVPAGAAPEYLQLSEIALAKAQKDGLAAAERWIHDQRPRGSVLSRVLLDLAKQARATDPAAAVALAKAAAEADPNEGRVKLLAFTLMDAGSIDEASAILQEALRAGAALNPTETRRYEELMALERFKGQGVRLPKPVSRKARSTRLNILLYVPQSLPYHWSAISMRTHALAQELTGLGCLVRVVTQPGYPVRNAGASRKSGPDVVDGIAYHRLAPVEAAPAIIDHYAREAGVALGRIARTLEADVIMVSGDLEAAYPAAIATRMTGADLVLDCQRVASTTDATPVNDREALFRQADDVLMAEASLMLARWPGATETLAARGIPAAKLLMLGENAPTFKQDEKTPAWRSDPALKDRLVLGYIGDPYEDLDLEGIGDAFDRLVADGLDVALVIFGVGSRFLKLHERLSHMGHGERVLFPGRPKVGAIAEAYKAIDIFVTPTLAGSSRTERTRFELVDALMHGKIIVASDGAVARAILGEAAVWIDEGENGLAQTLGRLAGDTSQRNALQGRSAGRAEEWRRLSSAGALVERLRKARAVSSS